MKRQILVGLVVLLSTGSLLAAQKPEFRPGVVLVRFAGDGSQLPNTAAKNSIVNSVLMTSGSPVQQEFSIVPGLAKVAIPSNMTVESAVASLKQSSSVLYAEPDYIYRISAVPTDPYFYRSWGLRNTAQFGGIAGADINAVNAWDISTGSSSIVVAVTDTGVDYNHPDLSANMWRNPGEIQGNGIDDDDNGYIDDVYGYDFNNLDSDPCDDHSHGTHVSGIIGAVGNNGLGVAGVSWHVKIMALKCFDGNGYGPVSNAISAVDYATAMGARVINASWGYNIPSMALYDAIARARDADIIFVAAAGNDSANIDSTPFYPAAFPIENIITVMATDNADRQSYFSNYGLINVDIGAPGGDGFGGFGDIYSTYPTDFGSYGYMAGTSMAAPYVAGACALLLSIDPNLSYSDAKQILLSTVDPELPGLCASGGRMNLYEAALEANRDTMSPSPNPPQWEIEPVATGLHTITMRAKTTQDRSGVEYYFECVNNVTVNSGWVSNSLYTFSDVNEIKIRRGTTYGFRFMARDKSDNQNQTDWSSTSFTTTAPGPDDDLPPAPNPPLWVIKPRVIRTTGGGTLVTIRMQAFSSDESGVQYYFEWVENPITVNSGWIDSDVWITPSNFFMQGGTYSFRVKARDKLSGIETAFSEPSVVTPSTGPRILPVPSIYSTIQAAINASNAGDVILISPGTYRWQGNWDIELRSWPVTIRSIEPENPDIVAQTIIDCNQVFFDANGLPVRIPHRGFIIRSGVGPDCVINGLTIINGLSIGLTGNSYDGSVFGLPPKAQENIPGAFGGAGQDATGGGIHIGKDPYYILAPNVASSPTIINCVISNCGAIAGNGGNGQDGGDGFDFLIPDLNAIPPRPEPQQATMGKQGGQGGYSGKALGGGIFVSIGSNPVIQNTIISSCYVQGGDAGNAGDGGEGGLNNPAMGGNPQQPNGLPNVGGDVNVIHGGGIYVSQNSSAQVVGCKIEDCFVIQDGNAGQGSDGEPNSWGPGLTGSNGNYGSGSGGGAFYQLGAFQPSISATQILRCQAGRGADANVYAYTTGGGIAFETVDTSPGVATLSDCTISYNSAGSAGDGIWYPNGQDGTTLTLTKCTVSGNSGNWTPGAGLYNEGADIEIYDSVFSDNRAGNAGGGALFLSFSNLTAKRSTFTNNESVGGGAIDAFGCTVEITDCNISNNQAVSSSPLDSALGGGIALWNSAGQNIIKDSVFVGNTSETLGGAILAMGWNNLPIQIKNCLIAENTANLEGGGLSANIGAWVNMENCTVTGNIVTNDLYGTGGGVVSTEYMAWVQINNSIFWDNFAAYGPQVAVGIPSDIECDGSDRMIADLDVSFSDIQGGQYNVFVQDTTMECTALWWNGGNIEVEPDFALDYHLKNIAAGQDVNSNCVDKGSDFVDDIDILMADYTTRTDGVADTGIVDLGFHHKAGLPKQYNLTLDVYDDGFGGYGQLNAHLDPNTQVQFDVFAPTTLPVNQGTRVLLTAMPATGFQVQRWYGTDDDTSIDVNNTVTMNSNRKVVVTYEPIGAYFLTITAVGNGTVTPLGRSMRPAGQVVNLTATQNNPADAIIWTGTDFDGSVDRYNTVTMNGHKNITVEFYTPRVLYVGGDVGYPTIQAAIDDARDGDIVQLAPSGQPYYTQQGFQIIGKNITISSVDPTDPQIVASTIIDQNVGPGGGVSPAFVFLNVGPHMRLQGITIRNFGGTGLNGLNGNPQNGYYDGIQGVTMAAMGIICAGNASPTILNCVINNCGSRGGSGGNGAGGDQDHPNGGNGGWPGGAWGGGLSCLYNSSPTVIGCTFSNNTAIGGNGGDGGNGGNDPVGDAGRGGGWYYGYQIPSPWESPAGGLPKDFSGLGGAVYVGESCSPKFENCTFTNNFSSGGTNGICGQVGGPSGLRPEPTIRYKIENLGGAVYVSTGATPTFSECSFTGNIADPNKEPASNDAFVGYGGAVAIEDGAMPLIANCQFSGSTSDAGGAIYSDRAYPEIRDSNFLGNIATQGGAVLIAGGTSIISNGRFTGNQTNAASALGGAIALLGKDAEIVDCNITNNQTAGLGGGIYVSSKDTVGLEIEGDNTVLIKNCLIARNSAIQGGGGISSNWHAEPNIINCTITENTSIGGSGGGLYATYNNYTNIINSIIWGNSAISGDEIAVGVPGYPSLVDVYYSDINQGAGALAYDLGSVLNLNDGVININPQFTGNRTYFLSQIAAGQAIQSSCVDAGADFASRFNMHKYSTRTDNVPDTGVVDIGYHPQPVQGCMNCDYSGDGTINFVDFAELVSYWLKEECSDVNGWCEGLDLTFDGVIDVYDLGDFAECWLFGMQSSDDVTAPAPNPMRWEVEPTGITETSVMMVAETATDNSGGQVQYEFERTVDGLITPGSGWQASPAFTDAGLTAGTAYCYRVRARDPAGNATDWSEQVCISNIGDTNAPTPAPAILFTPGVYIVLPDVCTISGQFQFPYEFPDWDMTWWHKVVVSVAGITDDSGGPIELRFFCSDNSLSSESRIPLALRPILLGQGQQLTLGSKANGWRLTYNGDTIVYDVRTTQVGGLGITYAWMPCVYDQAGNSACGVPVTIGP